MRWIVVGCLVTSIGFGGAGNAYAYRSIGSGNSSCGTWTAEQQQPDSVLAIMDVQWIFGFLSGVGWVAPSGVDPLGGLDGYAVTEWIDNYCRAHPLDNMIKAAAEFVYAHPYP